jgi:fructoselysine-6-P-deglycase FrlB-like protein
MSDPIARYIREQPDVIARVFAEVPAALVAVAALPRRPDAVVLVGSGTSRHALLSVESFIARRLQCPVRVTGPLELMADPPPWARAGALGVLLSQSGASTTTIEAIGFARRRGMATLAITAEAGSPVAGAGGPVLIMPIGPEAVGPKTKGYTGSIAALLCLGLGLGGDVDWSTARAEAAAACGAMAGAMESWREAATALARRHAAAPYTMIVGQGRHLATAHEGALKITEMSGIPAGAHDTEEALHGRFHALDASTPALFLARAGVEIDVAQSAEATLASLGIPGHVLAIGCGGGELDVNIAELSLLPELDLVLAAVPLQWLAWALANARGMPPDRMRYPDLSARLGIKTPAAIDGREAGR